MALNNVTFFVFWWVLMQRTPSLRGWRLVDIQVLFGVVAAGYGLTVTLAGGVRYLGQAIEEGVLDTLLTQPRPVLLHALGLRLQPSGFGDMLSGLAVHRVVGSALLAHGAGRRVGRLSPARW